MENETIIMIIAALGAGASFAAFAYPFLQKSDQKEKYKSIIEKRRKDLMQQARQGGNKIVKEGWFEVAPPKTHVLKEVFGGKNEEALTMIRVGTAQNCSGVLIVLSAKSLKPEVTQTLLKAA